MDFIIAILLLAVIARNFFKDKSDGRDPLGRRPGGGGGNDPTRTHPH